MKTFISWLSKSPPSQNFSLCTYAKKHLLHNVGSHQPSLSSQLSINWQEQIGLSFIDGLHQNGQTWSRIVMMMRISHPVHVDAKFVEYLCICHRHVMSLFQLDNIFNRGWMNSQELLMNYSHFHRSNCEFIIS